MSHFLSKMKDKVHAHQHHEETKTETHIATPAPVIIQHNVDMTAAPLEIHNKARSAKGNPAMVWDDGLAKDAAGYAQKLADKDKMEHSGTKGQGENLFMASNDATFEDAVHAWLNEESKYKGQKIGEPNLADWGHYTQCLWKSSTHLGMGKAKTKDGKTYIVARYTPQGNMMGEKPY